MGSGGSKPEQHVFNADTPVRFSQSVVDSLQNSPEACLDRTSPREGTIRLTEEQTDSTRAKDLDLKVQQRVHTELQRIRDNQATQLSNLTASLTTNPPKPGEATPIIPSQHSPDSLAAHLSSPFYQDHASPSGAAASPKRASESDRSHNSVQKEIMSLRQKLDERKTLDKVSPSVEKAKKELVTCLRTNDRRPLDCWQEVESFKREVGKLEQAFVMKARR